MALKKGIALMADYVFLSKYAQKKRRRFTRDVARYGSANLFNARKETKVNEQIHGESSDDFKEGSAFRGE